MGLLIKDRNGIYDDTAIPQAYDRALGAYRDAESALVRDGEIWREVWPDKHYFYRNGMIPTGIEWGIDFTHGPLVSWKKPGNMSLESDRIKFHIDQSSYMQVCYSGAIDFTKWNRLYADVTVEENTGGQNTPVYLIAASDTRVSFGEQEIFASTEIYASGIMEIDVSGINGLAYIRLQAQNHSQTASYRNTGYYTEIYATK